MNSSGCSECQTGVASEADATSNKNNLVNSNDPVDRAKIKASNSEWSKSVKREKIADALNSKIERNSITSEHLLRWEKIDENFHILPLKDEGIQAPYVAVLNRLAPNERLYNAMRIQYPPLVDLFDSGSLPSLIVAINPAQSRFPQQKLKIKNEEIQESQSEYIRYIGFKSYSHKNGFYLLHFGIGTMKKARVSQSKKCRGYLARIFNSKLPVGVVFDSIDTTEVDETSPKQVGGFLEYFSHEMFVTSVGSVYAKCIQKMGEAVSRSDYKNVEHEFRIVRPSFLKMLDVVVSAPSISVIRNDESYRRFLQRAQNFIDPYTSQDFIVANMDLGENVLPLIDFRRNMVIAVNWGFQHGDGLKISLESASVGDNILKIDLVLQSSRVPFSETIHFPSLFGVFEKAENILINIKGNYCGAQCQDFSSFNYCGVELNDTRVKR